jgi:hypothetical protein
MKRETEKENDRCGGKLIESLRKLPKTIEGEESVTTISLTIRSGQLEAAATMEKWNGSWYIGDMDVDTVNN